MPDYPDHIIKVERAPEKAEFNSTYDNAALVYYLAGRSGLYYNVHNTSTDHFAVVYMIVAGIYPDNSSIGEYNQLDVAWGISTTGDVADTQWLGERIIWRIQVIHPDYLKNIRINPGESFVTYLYNYKETQIIIEIILFYAYYLME
jgi:hypothetical protein